MSVILFKAAVVLSITFLGIHASRLPALAELPERSFIGRLLALQLLPALALFFGLYVIGNQQVPSDVPAFYIPAARAVIAGQLPFRDFSLSYAPLFPYIGGGLLLLWNDAKAFPLFAILVNAIALLLWHRAAVSAVDRQTARQSSILYATSGHLAYQTILGTNQVWISAGLAASVLFLQQERSSISGLAQGIAVSVTKFLTLLFWPVLWICAPRRALWALAATLLGGAVYGAFTLAGGDVLYALRHEGSLISSGNIPYLLDPIVQTAPRLFDAATLSILGLVTLWLYWIARTLTARQRPALVFAGLVLVGSVFMLISKKSFTVYAVFFMYPAMLLLVRRALSSRLSAMFLLSFNTILAIEPSVWFRLGGGRPLQEWLPHVSLAAAVIFILLELLLLACYGYLTCLSVGSTRQTGSVKHGL